MTIAGEEAEMPPKWCTTTAYALAVIQTLTVAGTAYQDHINWNEAYRFDAGFLLIWVVLLAPALLPPDIQEELRNRHAMHDSRSRCFLRASVRYHPVLDRHQFAVGPKGIRLGSALGNPVRAARRARRGGMDRSPCDRISLRQER